MPPTVAHCQVASTASKPAKKASDEAKGAKTAKWQTKKEEQGSQERQGAKVHPTGQIPVTKLQLSASQGAVVDRDMRHALGEQIL